ncbi:MAG: arginine repressor [Bacillota bacterium]|nr:arginine repressor [Bacillota bacterium]
MKSRRHKMIREIIEQKNIETQYQLTRELIKHGLSVTQATISRDIKELGLVKVASGDNSFRYGFSPGLTTVNTLDRAKRMLRDNLLRVDLCRGFIVLKTLPGTAQGVGFCIDGLGWKEICGCIAGDDTILVIAAEEAEPAELADRLREMMV